jgi:hypothetical protein
VPLQDASHTRSTETELAPQVKKSRSLKTIFSSSSNNK